MRILAAVIVAIALTLTGCKPSQGTAAKENPFVERFMGKWESEVEGVKYTLELRDGVELVGVRESELLSRAEFSVEEINEDEKYIVIRGIQEELADLEDAGVKTEYRSKLMLKENGRKLLYIYDYRNAKMESEWRREEGP